MIYTYHFDDNGYYTGSSEAFLNPEETRIQEKAIYLLPANATFTAPNQDRYGYVQRWDGNNWEYVENHVGKHGYVNGVPCEIKEYGRLPEGWSDTPLPPTKDELETIIRGQRAIKLTETDYLVMPDYPISESSLMLIKEYRRKLRDITKQEGFPNNVIWPEKPEI